MLVCVLNKDKTPIHMTCQARARKLLKQKKAVIHRKHPFVIRMKDQIDTSKNVYEYELRDDPGSKTSGFALLKDKREVIALIELEHRQGISESLKQRSDSRRNRRNRNTRYRKCKWKEAIRLNQRYQALKKLGKSCKKPSFGKESKGGWIAPSLKARVHQTKNLIVKLRKYIPITSLSMELVKFDMQKMEDPEISGVEYQQGTLMGYEIREYLLEKWERKCSYCNIEGVPLEIEHVTPDSRGGSSCISNLCLACRTCNEEKDNMYLDEWLKKIGKKKNKRHTLIKENIPKVLAQLKKPLRDAAVVNTTRLKLSEELESLGLPLYKQSGAKTKMQRIQAGFPKEHYYDALSVGEMPDSFYFKTKEVDIFTAKGRGNRQMVRLDKYGFPYHHLDKEKYDENGKRKGHRERKKLCHGFQTGDIAYAVVTKGKKIGKYKGRIAIRHTGYFDIKDIHTNTLITGISYKCVTLIQRNDGWEYSKKNLSLS